MFPLVYASLFSGFYLAFMLVLFVMILRTVAMEFRSKEPSPRWRSFWDMVFALASTGLAFLLGVAFGDVLSGVPLDANGNMSVSLIGLLKPVPLLVGRDDGRDVRDAREPVPRPEDRGRSPGPDPARRCRG